MHNLERGVRIYDRYRNKEGVVVENAKSRGWLVQYDGETNCVAVAADHLSPSRPEPVAAADAADERIERLSKPAPPRSLSAGSLGVEKQTVRERKINLDPAPPGFVPRITIEPSRVNPGNRNFVWNFPGNRSEPYGVVGKFDPQFVLTRYVEELARRFRIGVDPDTVHIPYAEADIQEVETEPEPAPVVPAPPRAAPEQVKQPNPQHTRSAWVLLADLLESSPLPLTISVLAAAIGRSNAATYQALVSHEEIFRVARREKKTEFWELCQKKIPGLVDVSMDAGCRPVAAVAEAKPSLTDVSISAPPGSTVTLSERVTETRVTEREAVITIPPLFYPPPGLVEAFYPAPPEAVSSVRPLSSPIPEDGPYLKELLDHSLYYWSRAMPTGKLEETYGVSGKIIRLTAEMRIWREAKAAVDKRMQSWWRMFSLEDDEAEQLLDQETAASLWIEMHQAVMAERRA